MAHHILTWINQPQRDKKKETYFNKLNYKHTPNWLIFIPRKLIFTKDKDGTTAAHLQGTGGRSNGTSFQRCTHLLLILPVPSLR